jgi:drug/metabolite transporter (DMT)-like permease
VLATKLTSAANAIFLQYTAPFYIALLSPVLLRERTHGSDWFFLGWALLGVGTFFLDRFSPSGLWGMGFALLSGLFFGSFIMLMRSQRETSPESAILYGNLLTVLAALPFMWPPSHLETNWPWLVALGVFQLTLPYVLYTNAIRHVRALDAALITFIEPILNPLWVMLINHEAPTNWSLVGGGLVLSATATRSVLLATGK